MFNQIHTEILVILSLECWILLIRNTSVYSCMDSQRYVRDYYVETEQLLLHSYTAIRSILIPVFRIDGTTEDRIIIEYYMVGG